MSYASGDLIAASDYNGLANVTVGGNVAWVWGVGYGAVGYGQDTSGLQTISAGSTVTATQWQSFFNSLNRCLGHQGQTLIMGGGNLNVVAGSTVTYFANISSAVTQVNSTYASYYAQGTTTTGSNFDESIVTSTGISNATNYGVRTVTFASDNQARLFFNAGGQINYYVSTPTGSGSGSQNSLIALINGLGGFGQRNSESTGRLGSGITLDTNNTTFGYRNNILNTATTVVQVTDTTAAYTTDVGYLDVYTSSSDTTLGANGVNIIFQCRYTVTDKTATDDINLTHRTRVDIVYPELTYLTNVWGSITIT